MFDICGSLQHLIIGDIAQIKPIQWFNEVSRDLAQRQVSVGRLADPFLILKLSRLVTLRVYDFRLKSNQFKQICTSCTALTTLLLDGQLYLACEDYERTGTHW